MKIDIYYVINVALQLIKNGVFYLLLKWYLTATAISHTCWMLNLDIFFSKSK